MIVQQVIDAILGAVNCPTMQSTIDTLKFGNPAQEVTRIVTTFMPTCEVIEKAAALRANLIIAHEPLFYNHPDDTEWLRDDPVYQRKCALLEKTGMAVWRFHDYWHRHTPDGIYVGMLRELGWEDAADPDAPWNVGLPPTTLGNLARDIKRKLGLTQVRVVGDVDMPCSRVGFMVGFQGVLKHVEACNSGHADVLVCGEIHEWETLEYVRDARRLGMAKGLIVLGHVHSEECGMKYLVDWLQPLLPGVPVTHVPAGDPIRCL